MNEMRSNIEAAEIVVPCRELADTLPFFLKELGFRLDQIFPADNPAVAVISGHGIRLRLDCHAKGEPGTLRLLANDMASLPNGGATRTAPNGTRIEFALANPPMVMPHPHHSFVVRRLKDGAVNRVYGALRAAHAGTRMSRKYSRSLGNSRTSIPVAASMRRATASISARSSTASTNHMFSSCSRR